MEKDHSNTFRAHWVTGWGSTCSRLSLVAGSHTSGPSRSTCGARLGKPAVADVLSNGSGSPWELEEVASITNVRGCHDFSEPQFAHLFNGH